MQVIDASGATKSKEVLIGLMTRAQAQILEGLAEGEQVVVTGASGATEKKKDGAKPAGMPPGMGARL